MHQLDKVSMLHEHSWLLLRPIWSEGLPKSGLNPAKAWFRERVTLQTPRKHLIPPHPGSVANIKAVFPDIGIPIIKIRRSWDRLIFIIGIPILVRGHFIWGRPIGFFPETAVRSWRNHYIQCQRKFIWSFVTIGQTSWTVSEPFTYWGFWSM